MVAPKRIVLLRTDSPRNLAIEKIISGPQKIGIGTKCHICGKPSSGGGRSKDERTWFGRIPL
jgi:hypothetical protein